MKVIIDTAKLNTFNFADYKTEWGDNPHNDGPSIHYSAGNQHYQLLATLTHSLPYGTKVFEVGTRLGMSSIAMYHGNPNIKLTTCDIEDTIPEGYSIKNIPDIKFIIKDGFELLEEYIDASVIFMDVDPHDGVQEKKMIEKLIELNYKGILLLDDIRLNHEMVELWNWIPLRKFDLTELGHYSGTGVVLFGDSDVSVIRSQLITGDSKPGSQ